MTARVTPELLERCLDDLMSGRATIDEVVAAHPREARELWSLLGVAASIDRPRPVAMDPAFRHLGRAALLTAIGPGRPRRSAARQGILARLAGLLAAPSGGASRFALRPAVIAALVAVLLLGTGTGAIQASQDTLPGDPLYSVKTSVEGVQLALAPSDEARTQLYLLREERRLAEMRTALQSGQPKAAIAAASYFVKEVDETDGWVSRATAAGRDVSGLAEQVTASRARQRAEIEAAQQLAPADLLPELEATSRAAEKTPAWLDGTGSGQGSDKSKRNRSSYTEPITGSTATVPVTATPTTAVTVTASPSVATTATVTATATAAPTATAPVTGTTAVTFTQAISDAQGLADDSRVSGQSYRGLQAKLDAARSALERGQVGTAGNILGAFGHEMEAFHRSGRISDASYGALLADYNALQQGLAGAGTGSQRAGHGQRNGHDDEAGEQAGAPGVSPTPEPRGRGRSEERRSFPQPAGVQPTPVQPTPEPSGEAGTVEDADASSQPEDKGDNKHEEKPRGEDRGRGNGASNSSAPAATAAPSTQSNDNSGSGNGNNNGQGQTKGGQDDRGRGPDRSNPPAPSKPQDATPTDKDKPSNGGNNSGGNSNSSNSNNGNGNGNSNNGNANRNKR